MPFCPNCGAGTSGATCEVCGHKAPPLQRIESAGPVRQLPPLSAGSVVGSAFRDAFAVMAQHTVPMIVMGVIVTLLGSLMFFGAHGDQQHQTAIVSPVDIFMLVITYYALAASIRTIQPSFSMTVITWFGNLGWSILVTLLTLAAGLAFIIPAFWVAPKLVLTPFIYLLNAGAAGENPLERSWRITTGHYWSTFGLMLVSALPIAVVVVFAYMLADIVRLTGIGGAFVAIPLLCFTYAWAYQVNYLAFARWTYLLLQYDVERGTAPLTA